MNGNIKFDIILDNKPAKVELTQPHGAGEGWWLMIDNYFWGQLYKFKGEWINGMHDISLLDTADISALTDIIDEHEAERQNVI